MSDEDEMEKLWRRNSNLTKQLNDLANEEARAARMGPYELSPERVRLRRKLLDGLNQIQTRLEEIINRRP